MNLVKANLCATFCVLKLLTKRSNVYVNSQVKSQTAVLVWHPPEDCGFEIQHYHVFLKKVGGTEDDAREAVVPASTCPHQKEGKPADDPEYHQVCKTITGSSRISRVM